MSMSTYVKGLRDGNSAKHKAMLKIWEVNLKEIPEGVIVIRFMHCY